MGQKVTFNSGSTSLEKIVVNSKIDLHRDSRRSEDKQGRGVKWVYGKIGINGMEGRVKFKKLQYSHQRQTGSSNPWISLLGMALPLFWKTGIRVGEE